LEWSDEQNVVAVGLALVEAQKPGTFTLRQVQAIVGPGASSQAYLQSRWESLLEELKRSLATISPAVQTHCRTGYSGTKHLRMVSEP
jgi:hypothetical protein